MNESFFVFSEFCPKKKEVFLLLHSLEDFWILLSPVSSIYWKSNNALSAPGPSIFSFSWLTLSVRCLANWGNNFASFFFPIQFLKLFLFFLWNINEMNDLAQKYFPKLCYITFLFYLEVPLTFELWNGVVKPFCG